MSSLPSFSISASVAHDVVEDEAVIVNLETGDYYSLKGVGADIWNLMGSAATNRQIINHINQRYKGSRQEIENGVAQLLEQLQAEGLIIPSDSAREISALSPPQPEASRPVFSLPVLEKYNDMQELLLLDPIHEADAQEGWPNPADDSVE